MMPEHFRQYRLTQILSEKYSHTTYLASPTDELERQVVLIMFTSSLFHVPCERENWLTNVNRIKQLQHPHLLPILQRFAGVLIPSMKLEGASSSGRGCLSMEKIR